VECCAEPPEINGAVEDLAGTAEFVGLNMREASLGATRAYVREDCPLRVDRRQRRPGPEELHRGA
jgi:hypothetical protein